MLAASSNVFPGDTSTQIRYMTRRDAKDESKVSLFFTGCATTTNFENLFGGKHCGRAIFAFLTRLVWPLSLTTFRHHILDVVQVRTKEQVIWITATLIVAAMQYVKITWYWAVGDLPSKTMNRVWIPINGKCSVTMISSAGSPIPAVVGTAPVDSFPKSLRNRLPVIVSTDIAATPARSGVERDLLSASAGAKCRTRWRRLFPALMATDILDRLIFDPPASLICGVGDTCFFAAATHAQSTWVRFFWGIRDMPAMTTPVEQWFADFPAASGICISCKIGLLATAAMAIAVGNFVRGVACGMLRHAEFSLLELGLAVGRSHRYHGLCIGSHSCKYTTSIPYLKECAFGGLYE
jgi:hypothetical protein